MNFVDDKVRPGRETSLRISASDSSSLCSVAVVDKSIELMGDTAQLTKSKVTTSGADTLVSAVWQQADHDGVSINLKEKGHARQHVSSKVGKPLISEHNRTNNLKQVRKVLWTRKVSWWRNG